MARDGAGIDVELDRVPLREPDLEPWEIIISESQERMVAVVRRDLVEAVETVCARWELHVARIGHVTDTGDLRATFHEETVGEIPARLLTDECPRYEVERTPRATAAPTGRKLSLSEPNVASKRWIYRQYDHLVGSRTVRRPGLDAAVIRLRPSLRGIAVSLQGPRLGELDPHRAGAQAVLGAALNVAVAGGEPIGLTDCLNFGNPEKPEIAWELEQAIEAIAEAADALGVAVVSGNVSLYNETDGRAIPPTPVVGCVGLVPDVRAVPRAWQEGDVVLAARADGIEEQAALVRWLARIAPHLSLAHDVGDGGPRAALAEAALWSGIGAELDVPSAARVIVACAPDQAGSLGRELDELGVVGGTQLFGHDLDDLRQAWEAFD
jgi:phosphoribosylformylglycinamidine synthase